MSGAGPCDALMSSVFLEGLGIRLSTFGTMLKSLELTAARMTHLMSIRRPSWQILRFLTCSWEVRLDLQRTWTGYALRAGRADRPATTA